MKISTNTYMLREINPTGLGVNNKSNEIYLAEEKSIINADTTSESNIWKDLSEKHDIRNATFDEFSDISSSLYNAGEISLLDHAVFTFNPKLSPQTHNMNYNVTQADTDGKMDWIAEFEARAQRDLKLGNYKGYTHKNKLLKILNKLN